MFELSIITITKDNASGLKRTLASISMLEKIQIQLILVIAGEIELTFEVLNSFVKLNPKVNLEYIFQESRGIYPAMNEGLSRARNPFVIFMNAGDEFYDQEELWNLADLTKTGKEYGLFLGGHKIQNREITYIRKERELNFRSFAFYLRSGSHQSILYRTSALKASGGYSLKYRLCSDYHVNLRILKHFGGYRVANIISAVEPGGVSEKQWWAVAKERHDIRMELLDVYSLKLLSFLLMYGTATKSILRRGKNILKKNLLNESMIDRHSSS